MKTKKSLTILFVWIFIFCFNSVALAANGNPGRPLFLPSPVTLDQEFLKNMKAKNPTIIRSRAVRIDLDLLSVQENAEGRGPAMTHSILMNLFDDVNLDVSFDRVEKNPSGSYSWVGKVRDLEEIVEESSVTIVNYDGIVMGSISSPDGFFNIRTLPNGQYIVNELDPSKLPEEGPPLYPPANNEEPAQGDTLTQSEITTTQSDTAAAGGPVVDVLVAYTPAVLNAVGSIPLVQALIDLAITETNTSYADSGVLHRLNLVHTHEVSYTGDTNKWCTYICYLTYLTSETDPYMNEIHSLRDQYGADMVVLLVDDSPAPGSAGIIGIAHQMISVSSSFENLAFSVVAYNYAGGPIGYSLAHETGHNMGAAHDRHVDSTGAYTYSHGFVNTSDRWRTIMAYREECTDLGFECDKIPNWSNPNIPVNDLPTGVPEGEPDSADNAKTLNNTAPTVAGFRPSNHSLSITGGPAGSPTVVDSGGQVQLNVTASDSSGHSLKYKWGSYCQWSWDYGSFNDPKSRTPVWTAPDNTSTKKQNCFISVTVSDGTGLSDYGSYWQGINIESDTSDTTPPNPPTGLTAKLIKYKGTKLVELSWNTATDPSPGSGIDYYMVYRNNIYIVSTYSTGHSDSNYTVGGSTVYTVYSVDNAGNVSTSAASVIFKDGGKGNGNKGGGKKK